MAGETKARRLTIQGRVQGVGFRYFTYREALKNDVTGWVRNLSDGNVEAHVEGANEQLDSLLGRLRQGPSFSVVDNIEEVEVPVEKCSEFLIKYRC